MGPRRPRERERGKAENARDKRFHGEGGKGAQTPAHRPAGRTESGGAPIANCTVRRLHGGWDLAAVKCR